MRGRWVFDCSIYDCFCVDYNLMGLTLFSEKVVNSRISDVLERENLVDDLTHSMFHLAMPCISEWFFLEDVKGYRTRFTHG